MEDKDNRNPEETDTKESESKETKPDSEAGCDAGAKENDADSAAEGSDQEVKNQEQSAEAAADEAEGDGQSAGEEAEEKGFFKKKKKDTKKEDAYKARIEELEDRVRRQMAEFDNFRKRTEREKSAMFDTGARSVIEKILPVVDSFERGLATIPEEEKGSAYAEGMNKIYRQLTTELDNMGVKPIEALGQEFDPAFHNAVMHVEDEEVGENIIVEEFQKGYLYRDVVVRHSMVKVAN